MRRSYSRAHLPTSETAGFRLGDEAWSVAAVAGGSHQVVNHHGAEPVAIFLGALDVLDPDHADGPTVGDDREAALSAVPQAASGDGRRLVPLDRGRVRVVTRHVCGMATFCCRASHNPNPPLI